MSDKVKQKEEREALERTYDECASGYRSSCQTLSLLSLSEMGKQVIRSWIKEWKKRMLYYDKKLAELGED